MSKRILVIEDDAGTRRALCGRLQAHGYATSEVPDAITAHSAAIQLKPALILLDLGLPGGDGLALLKKLHALPATSGIPVIVLTGRDPQVEHTARAAGAIAFFQKPPEIDQLIAAIEQQIGKAADRAVAAPAPKKILVVEDDAATRLGLTVRLRKAGYDTTFAADASTAATIALREKPSLVILDLGLPGGDGFLVLERLKTMAALPPVIVLSASDSEVTRARALQAGARAYFQKPADMSELLETIRKQLDR